MTDWNQIWELVIGLLSALAIGLGFWVRKLRTDLAQAEADRVKSSVDFAAFFTAMNNLFAFVKQVNADKNFTQETFDSLMDKVTEVMTKGQQAITDAEALVQDGKTIGDDIIHIIDIFRTIQKASSSGSPTEIMSKLSAIKYNIGTEG